MLELSLAIKYSKCEAKRLEYREGVLCVKLENGIACTSKLSYKGSDIDTFLTILEGDHLEVLDGGFGDPALEVVVVALGLGVPLGRVVHEGVELAGCLLVFYLFKHAVFLLKGLVFVGFASGLVDARDNHLGFAQLPYAAGHVLVLDSHVLVPDA